MILKINLPLSLHSLKAKLKNSSNDGSIGGGMIPKVEACLHALDSGTGKACIIDGREAHSLILELFTSQGIGTEVVR